MTPMQENDQLQRIRERFTRTADDFANFALTKRGVEADRLARLALADVATPVRRALDLACGPGTFARSFAPHAAMVLGVDYTSAMLAKARSAMAQAGLSNILFVRCDGNQLPLADNSFDLAACGYSLHHFADPARALHEMVRVVRPGGRVAVADIFVPAGASSEANNRIERARDVSHVRTLGAPELRGLFEQAGLVIRATETDERPRDFDDWMKNVSHPPGSPVYQAVRNLIEVEIGSDTTGFRPCWKAEAGGAIEIVQPSFFIVGERLV
jgi:ubiquinone/menaquinone biosynthesis C-methylase UbiE